MIIEWEGRKREINVAKVGIEQAFVIKETTKDDAYPAGRGLKAWQEGLNDVDPACLRALYWLMLQQEGHKTLCVSLEFPAIEFNNAVVEAVLAEQAERAREEAARQRAEEDAAAADAAIPTPAPSPEPPSPPTSTPPPQDASANGS